MKQGVFITGTDTGVGKTYVAAKIASALKARGVNIGVMKPAETGCRTRNNALVPKDALKLIKAAGACDPLDLVNPYRFMKPLAPALAAEIEGNVIEADRIVDAYQQLRRKHEFMVVEGAGGIMVPLFREYTYLNLVVAIKLPVLIVARPGLGTINHTLLTISALRSRGITISGIVINYAQKQKEGLAERTSAEMIERISGVKILQIIRHGSRTVEEIIQYLR